MFIHEKFLTRQSLIIFIMGAFINLYEFILEIAPSTMVNDLMQDLRLDAAQFGFLSGIFYYAYAPMQIIAGLLYDYL